MPKVLDFDFLSKIQLSYFQTTFSKRTKILVNFAEFMFKVNQILIETIGCKVIKPRYEVQIEQPNWQNIKNKIFTDNPLHPKNFFSLYNKFVSNTSSYCPVDCKSRFNHLQNLYSNPLNHEFAKSIESKIDYYHYLAAVEDGPLDNPILLEEVMFSLENSKTNTAFGFDNLPLKVLKEGKQIFAPFLTSLFNQFLDAGFLPPEFHVARLASFVKPGKPPEDPASYRNISVLISLFRILDGIIANRTYEFTKTKISNAQGGFRKGIGTVEHFFILREMILASHRNGLHCFCVLLILKLRLIVFGFLVYSTYYGKSVLKENFGNLFHISTVK